MPRKLRVAPNPSKHPNYPSNIAQCPELCDPVTPKHASVPMLDAVCALPVKSVTFSQLNPKAPCFYPRPTSSTPDGNPINPKSQKVSKGKLLYFNARSIFNKMNRVITHIDKIKPVIVSVAETWLTEAIPTAAIDVPGFSCIRKDAISKHPSGGVAMYIHEQLKYEEMNTEQLGSFPSIEYICATIQSGFHKKFIVCTIYNHPPVTTEAVNFISKIMEFLSTKGPPFYLVGDFNINMMNTANTSTILLNENMSMLNLKQMVNIPTHLFNSQNGELKKSTIDLLITNSADSITNIKPCLKDQIADHSDLIVTMSLPKPRSRKATTRVVRQMKKYSKEALQSKLIQNNITHCVQGDDIETCSLNFNQSFMNAIDELCPPVLMRRKAAFAIKHNTEIKQALNKKSKLLKKINKPDSTPSELKQLKAISKKLDKLVRTEKKKRTQHTFLRNSKNPKKLWAAMRQHFPMNSQKPVISENDVNEELLESFKTHYANVGKNIFEEVHKATPDYPDFAKMPKINYPSFKIRPIEVSELHKIVYSLNPSNTIGTDKLSLKLIKDSLPVTSLAITQLINLSIITNKIPAVWKQALITPVHKNGEIKPENFRPISILPVLSKILEKVVAQQLVSHCERLKIFNNQQFGFRKASNTSMAIANITENAYKSLDKGRIGLLVMLDLSKAFDSLPHPLLLKTLEYYNL